MPRPLHVPASAFWFLESPAYDRPWDRPDTLRVSGWLTAPTTDLSVRWATGPLSAEPTLAWLPRPDVEGTFGMPARGFDVSFAADDLPVDGLELALRAGDDESFVFVPTKDRFEAESSRRMRKAAELTEHLQCAMCASTSFRRRFGTYSCRGCGSAISKRGSMPLNFLPESLRQEFSVVSTDNVSANDYDPIALDLINRLHSGLILDCGAGLRGTYYHNVVNLEIVSYPSTDVLAVGERLPFKDATFDAVFSFAVLEHVKDPFTCAREIERVLKPGGVLYAQIPFLQPLHAYPHHYYNMSEAGAASLFKNVELAESGVFPFGQPIFTLSWFLNSYAAGLDDSVRERFLDMRVGDLVKPGQAYLGEGFVYGLSGAAKSELASCNYLIGTKASS